ncbi:MAG: hypothetical protein PHY12_05715 [Eubacteriales bacterium]|nr:hypothetical protein [Eubacteriales bacterium]
MRKKIDKIDFELDFDLSDFVADFDAEPTQSRILKPKMDIKSISHRVAYRKAEEMAEQIDLSKGARTFCWVNGSFYFGDLIEALVAKRGVGIKNLYVSTLSLNQENVDSLHNVITLLPTLEHVTLLLSGYFYSHYKYDLVPYLYEKLDIADKTQIAFCNTHCKIICIETAKGNFYTIHGSANLRSSNSIEQIMFEEGKELYDFNAQIMDGIAEAYGTIDHSVQREVRGMQSWQAVADAAKSAEAR